jgi:primosomal protein N' (replication factor Y) (superfamily II helicase)
MTVARVVLPIGTDQSFDYWIPNGVQAPPGSIVRVRLARRLLSGVVVEHASEADVDGRALAPIEEVSALRALPPDVLELARFVATYYQAPLGQALALALPPARSDSTPHRDLPAGLQLTEAGRIELRKRLRRASRARALLDRLEGSLEGLTRDEVEAATAEERRLLRAWRAAGWVAPGAALPAPRRERLNDAQQAAVDAIANASGFAAFLLQGVTGSGKTAVYLEAAQRIVARNGQVLMLVPEINLTPQFEVRVQEALPGVATVSLHSGLADGERRAAWEDAAAGRARVVLGTRLAVFAPLPQLALIVVDEEHDASYKQQDGVRYHARDLALLRGRHRGVTVVLGSATPSLESWAHAQAGRYATLRLPLRADPNATMPAVRFVADREARRDEGLSEALLDALRSCVERGEQALVFVNRRGFAPSYKCCACGWEAGCTRCTARLTVHREARELRCHHCGHTEALRVACPECGNVDLLPQGFGTQRLERALAQALPHARIARVDRDSTRARGAFAAMRSKVEAREIDVLVGTQMLAKGHDFPRLTLVGVLGADNALYSADFRATERAAALLMQVVGRAGRSGLRGEAIIQTDYPRHAVYAAVVAHDYDALARTLLAERQAARLPPTVHAALLEAHAHRREHVDRFLAWAHEVARGALQGGESVEVFAPVSALMAKRAGYERGQVLAQSTRRADLQAFLARWRSALAQRRTSNVRWAIDVDPASF